MNNEKLAFLNLLGTTSARVTAEEASWLLGFAGHDIPVLVKAGLLKPLGRPASYCIKFFATVELEGLRHDVKWLSRASDVIVRHWQVKNALRQTQKNIQAPSATTQGVVA